MAVAVAVVVVVVVPIESANGASSRASELLCRSHQRSIAMSSYRGHGDRAIKLVTPRKRVARARQPRRDTQTKKNEREKSMKMETGGGERRNRN